LVPDPKREAEWSLVKHDGQRDEKFSVTHNDALKYAEATAESFGVGSDKKAVFDGKTAKAELEQSKEDRKKARRAKGK
jgi:hypothetical protein